MNQAQNRTEYPESRREPACFLEEDNPPPVAFFDTGDFGLEDFAKNGDLGAID